MKKHIFYKQRSWNHPATVLIQHFNITFCIFLLWTSTYWKLLSKFLSNYHDRHGFSVMADLSQMREEFATHDVFQDHVDIAGVVEWAEHVHDEGMLQLGQNPKRRWPGFYASVWWFTIRSWLEPAGAKHGTWEQEVYAVGTWSFSYWGGEMVALWWLYFSQSRHVPATLKHPTSQQKPSTWPPRLCFSLMMWSTCFILMIAACPRMIPVWCLIPSLSFSEMGFLHSSSNHKIYPYTSPYTQAHLYAWRCSAYILSKIKHG